MKKKLLSVVLSTAMVASLLVGCGNKTEEAPAATDEATDAATDEATDAATDEATDAATDEEADVEKIQVKFLTFTAGTTSSLTV